MFKCFCPAEYAVSISEINYDALYERGVRGLVFDIDNTIEPYDIPETSAETEAFLTSLVKKGFEICFLSNNGRERVNIFNRRLGFRAMHNAGKPKKSAFLAAAGLLGVKPENIAIIGDQIFTDILCGNRCGAVTILVRPVSRREEWFVKLKRPPEKLVLKICKICEKKTGT